MTRALRSLSVLAFFVAITVSASAQDRTLWRTTADIAEGVRGSYIGTVTDVEEGARRFTVQGDDDRYGRVMVITDSVSTQYNGFGGVINGKPEIFTGSSGFANVREGDRVEVRGTGTNNKGLYADFVTLLGRTTGAGQVGVGQTRPANSPSTPTTSTTAPSAAYSRAEGMIRQINQSEGRLVIETDRRELITVRVANGTPVYYRNDVYTIRNLEVGDRVRVEADSSTSTDREMRARSIEVTQSVQDRGTTSSGDSRRFTTISGRITRVDRTNEVIAVDTGRESVRIDMRDAADPDNRAIRIADLHVGDRVEVAGNYNGDTFIASTVRSNEDVFGPAPRNDNGPAASTFVMVTVTGTVTESLDTASTLVVRDRTSGRSYDVLVAEDFLVRTKSGGTTTADKLKVNDTIVLKAYRDDLGNYIAQTIRLR